MNDLSIPGLAYAEANWGRWIARCPSGLCTNAIHVERWEQRFACSGAGACGWTSPIVWPADPEGIEVLLAMRPDARNRNWLPNEGLADLVAENAAHGVLPASWTDEGGCLLETRDERVIAGRLVAALPEYRRREIGVS